MSKSTVAWGYKYGVDGLESSKRFLVLVNVGQAAGCENSKILDGRDNVSGIGPSVGGVQPLGNGKFAALNRPIIIE